MMEKLFPIHIYYQIAAVSCIEHFAVVTQMSSLELTLEGLDLPIYLVVPGGLIFAFVLNRY